MKTEPLGCLLDWNNTHFILTLYIIDGFSNTISRWFVIHIHCILILKMLSVSLRSTIHYSIIAPYFTNKKLCWVFIQCSVGFSVRMPFEMSDEKDRQLCFCFYWSNFKGTNILRAFFTVISKTVSESFFSRSMILIFRTQYHTVLWRNVITCSYIIS